MHVILRLPYLSLPFLPIIFAQFGFIDFPAPVPQLPPIPSQLTATANIPSTVVSSVAAKATLAAHQNSVGLSYGTPNISLPDPCGPASQINGHADSRSTCDRSVYTNNTNFQDPGAYNVSCQHCNSSSGHQVPNITTCQNEMISICYTMAGLYGATPTDEWTFGNQGGNCTLGFWLPKVGAPPPSYARCVDQIFEVIAATCLEPKFNIGTVNLIQLPDMEAFNKSALPGTFGTGRAVDPGYPSYIMLAQQSDDV